MTWSSRSKRTSMTSRGSLTHHISGCLLCELSFVSVIGDWCVGIAEHGGSTLRRYEKYHRIVKGDDGRYTVPGRRLAAIHRLNIGTITGDGTISIRYRNGARIGSIEERFVAALDDLESGSLVVVLDERQLAGGQMRAQVALAIARYCSSFSIRPEMRYSSIFSPLALPMPGIFSLPLARAFPERTGTVSDERASATLR